jgi:hypothetical protein
MDWNGRRTLEFFLVSVARRRLHGAMEEVSSSSYPTIS